MLFKDWKPSLTTVVLMFSLVTITGFSKIVGTCARCHCEYEWGVHIGLLADRVGLQPTTVAATVTAPASDPLWSDRDRCLISLVDALHTTSTISDGLWTELRTHWDEQQIPELTVLAGFYHLISFIANVAHAPLERWAPRFPSSPSGPR